MDQMFGNISYTKEYRKDGGDYAHMPTPMRHHQQRLPVNVVEFDLTTDIGYNAMTMLEPIDVIAYSIA